MINERWAAIKELKALVNKLSDERYKGSPPKERIAEIIIETNTLNASIHKLESQIEMTLDRDKAYILENGNVLVPSDEHTFEEWEVFNTPTDDLLGEDQ